MFICQPCLEKNYTNWAIGQSFGKCEICNTQRPCFDIPSQFLNPIKKKAKIKTMGDLELFLMNKFI